MLIAVSSKGRRGCPGGGHPAVACARTITKARGGDWSGSYGLLPGPGHSAKDRSLKVWDDIDGAVKVHSFAGDDWRDCRAYLGLDGDQGPIARRERPPRPVERDPEPDRTEAALEIWRASRPAPGTAVERYLAGRGITIPAPPSIRYHPGLRHGPTGLTFEALVAGICGNDRRVVGVHRIYLLPGGTGTARVTQPKRSLGHVAGGAVRLTPAAETLLLAESIEDGLALLQMTGTLTWAVPSASFMGSFDPPEGVEEIILAPDNDEAGLKAIATAAPRLGDKGFRVRHMLPPAGADWCDVLDTYEERAGIRQFDGGADRQEAERLAFEEVIHGR